MELNPITSLRGTPVSHLVCRARLAPYRILLTTASAAVAEEPVTATASSPAVSYCPFGGGRLYTRVTDTEAPCPMKGIEELSVQPADYTPWKEPPFRISKGLHPLEDGDIVEIDEFYEEEMEERRQLLKLKHDDVLQTFPECEEGSQELLEVLADLLPRRYPDRFRLEGNILHNLATAESWQFRQPEMHPLEVCARLVQEDLALLLPDAKGRHRLVGGAIIFPMRWALAQKMGRVMNLIHAPVPFYQQELKRPVDDFMSSLTSQQGFWRANWGITDEPALYQLLTEADIVAAKKNKLLDPDKGKDITVQNAADRLFMRCERQTLTRLPRSGAALFTVRTYVRPMREYAGRFDQLQRLRNALEELPEQWVSYKTMNNIKQVSLDWMDSQLQQKAAK